jgi:hypothetical protein
MTTPWIFLGLSLNCCNLPTSYESYEKLPLPEQIEAWKQTRRELSGVCHVNSLQWLHRIADHGYMAAASMIPLIYHPDPDFPMSDALDVIERVHRGGCDLRNEEVVKAVTWASDTASDAAARARAAEVLRAIETVRPSPQLQCPDVPLAQEP